MEKLRRGGPFRFGMPGVFAVRCLVGQTVQGSMNIKGMSNLLKSSYSKNVEKSRV
jgi:hypothetical protein